MGQKNQWTMQNEQSIVNYWDWATIATKKAKKNLQIFKQFIGKDKSIFGKVALGGGAGGSVPIVSKAFFK